MNTNETHKTHYKLQDVLARAFSQAADGKGQERHGDGKAFEDQPIANIGRAVGTGFNTGQVLKKVEEAQGMIDRGELERAIPDLLGAIVYAASTVMLVEELISKRNAKADPVQTEKALCGVDAGSGKVEFTAYAVNSTEDGGFKLTALETDSSGKLTGLAKCDENAEMRETIRTADFNSPFWQHAFSINGKTFSSIIDFINSGCIDGEAHEDIQNKSIWISPVNGKPHFMDANGWITMRGVSSPVLEGCNVRLPNWAGVFSEGNLTWPSVKAFKLA